MSVVFVRFFDVRNSSKNKVSPRKYPRNSRRVPVIRKLNDAEVREVGTLLLVRVANPRFHSVGRESLVIFRENVKKQVVWSLIRKNETARLAWMWFRVIQRGYMAGAITKCSQNLAAVAAVFLVLPAGRVAAQPPGHLRRGRRSHQQALRICLICKQLFCTP